MVTKKVCSFCGRSIEPGTGKMVVSLSGSISFYCSSKCEKNKIKLGRNPRKIKWTMVYQNEKGIRLKGLSQGKKEGTEKEEKAEPKEEVAGVKAEKPKEAEEKAGKKGEKKAKTKQKAKKEKKPK
ncbi:MAG: hypothetical protein JXB14_02235 [Candidatus Altiarchaeota archaeon]|nr:hypothetical protein [Candidatus Altiarchaeota archaeon]